MRIGILQAGHSPEALSQVHGNYGGLFEKMLAGQGFDFTIYNVVDMSFPKSSAECDGWLITGSKHGAYDDLPFIAPLEVLIRDIYVAELPLVGICFGHQIIAQALGGIVKKFDGGWVVGRQTYDWRGASISLNAWHQDQVVEPPKGATPIAGNAFCQNAALIYGKRAFTVQAHPEFDAAFIADLAEQRGRGVVPDELLNAALDQLDQPIDNAILAQQIGTFFKERVTQ